MLNPISTTVTTLNSNSTINLVIVIVWVMMTFGVVWIISKVWGD